MLIVTTLLAHSVAPVKTDIAGMALALMAVLISTSARTILVALTPPARIWMATSTAIAMKATKATVKLSVLTSTNATTILALISQTARIVLVHSSVFANRDSLAMVLALKAVLMSTSAS
jgi:hypothetical protein